MRFRFYVISLFYVFHTFILYFSLAINNFPAVELRALKDLYYATNGQHWKWRNGTIFGIPWKITEPNPNPCAEKWQGIRCTSTCTTLVQCNVNQIVLLAHNLVGTIPPSIGNFTKLYFLDLSTNALYGSIPHTIGSLTLLQYLYLESNTLTGSIPSTIGHLTKLSSLDVETNRLTHTIPNELYSLHAMEDLYMDKNFFTGTLSHLFFTAFPSLTYFGISQNNIYGTISPKIGNYIRLKAFSINDNLFSGSIPEEIGRLQALSALNINQNRFTSTLPATISNLSSLTTFNFFQNHFNGTIPENLTGLHSIQQFVGYWNALTGTLSRTFSTLPNLQVLMLSDNHLTGTIPSDYFINMTNFVEFSMFFNYFHGEIPDSIYELTNMQVFNIETNLFFGTLSPKISNYRQMTSMNIADNFLYGTLPCPSFLPLQSMRELVMSFNYFNGSLCESFGNMKNLMQLQAQINFLSGTLPASFGNLSKLIDLELSANLLTGTIPNSFGNLVLLQDLVIFDNFLTGTIPSIIGNIKPLTNLRLEFNRFTGTIPLTALAKLPLLQVFSCYFNELTGRLFTNEFCQNAANMSNNPLLNVIDVYSNQLTGNIPAPACNALSSLGYLLFEYNYLTGNLDALSTWNSLTYVNMTSNYFTGHIQPNTFLHSSNVTELDFSFNLLSGTVNSLFTNVKSLNTLAIKSNVFSGNLNNLVDFSQQEYLSAVDVSDNQFTGTIPAALLQGITLLSFAAVKNCLTGSIPVEVCTNPSLQTLALDGLYTASRCQDLFFPHSAVQLLSSSSYQLVQYLSGGIPSCLFNMSSLHTLHLSGNGLTGTIPDAIPISPILKTLSLSYNQLSGSIPLNIQEKEWSYLDLSYNKLNGVLRSSFATVSNESTLILAINRLSGSIPDSIVSSKSKSLDILTGNLFSCDEGTLNADGTSISPNLPAQDKNADTYSCGTNSIDDSFYTWIAVVGCFVLLLAAASRMITLQESSQLTSTMKTILIYYNYLKGWLVFSQDNNFHELAEITSIIRSLKIFRNIVIFLTVFAIFILLPIFAILSTYEGTLTYSYAWTISIGYLSGITPAICLFVLFVVCALIVYGWYSAYKERFIGSLSDSISNSQPIAKTIDAENQMDFEKPNSANLTLEKNDEVVVVNNDVVTLTRNGELKNKEVYGTATSTHSSLSWMQDSFITWLQIHWMHLLYGTFLVLLNIIVVLTVNIAYVYGTTLSLSTQKMTLMVIAISVFKIVWTHIVILGILVRYMKYAFRAEGSDIQRVYFLSHIVIFNNIIAPLVADAFVDPNCFYHVIQAPATESVTYVYYSCSNYYVTKNNRLVCGALDGFLRSAGYIPPFIYSFQCASSLLDDFITVFVYRYLFSGILGPVVSYFLKYLQDKNIFLWFLQSNAPVKKEKVVVEVELNRMTSRADDESHVLAAAVSNFDGNTLNPLQHEENDKSFDASTAKENQIPGMHENSSESAEKNNANFKHALEKGFRSQSYLISFVGDIAVLITFGWAFPPLAIVICFSMYMNNFTQLLWLARWLHSAQQMVLDLAKQRLKLTNDETHKEIHRSLLTSLQPMIPSLAFLSSSFMAFFLFDMLGDEVGAIRAIWIFVVTATMPAWISGLWNIFNMVYKFCVSFVASNAKQMDK